MEANLRRLGDIMVIRISGALDIEETQQFRDVCKERLAGQKLVFNMQNASFVGSTGIQPFLDAIQCMDQNCEFGVRLVGARSEFKKIISSLEGRHIQFFEDEGLAIKDWTRPSLPDSSGDSTPG